MSRIRSKNTKPEVFVFEELKKLGLAFETHHSLPGKPDIVFSKEKVAVFIDGEFWHGKYLKKIKHRLSDYWVTKITNNRKRDRKNRKLLKSDGWHIIKLWDDDIKKHPKRELLKIIKAVTVKIET